MTLTEFEKLERERTKDIEFRAFTGGSGSRYVIGRTSDGRVFPMADCRYGRDGEWIVACDKMVPKMIQLINLLYSAVRAPMLDVDLERADKINALEKELGL
jgi:hypothetical protein